MTLLNEERSHYFTVQVYEALKLFYTIMALRGINFETFDDLIFYTIHLALTFVHIKDLKIELEEFEHGIESTKKNNRGLIHD